MFHDLKEAYQEMMKNCKHGVDNHGTNIVFPEELFRRFEQEWAVCFIDPEDDVAFKNWGASWEDEDE